MEFIKCEYYVYSLVKYILHRIKFRAIRIKLFENIEKIDYLLLISARKRLDQTGSPLQVWPEFNAKIPISSIFGGKYYLITLELTCSSTVHSR